jgi:lysozyme
MKTSERGIKLIKDSEGLRLRAYKCPGDVWTIGYGHAIKATESHFLTEEITESIADLLLRKDIIDAELAVKKYVDVAINQNQFDALVSFVFNLGPRALARSTLLKKLNDGKMLEVPAEFKRWVYADGKILEGLRKRRNAEAELFKLEDLPCEKSLIKVLPPLNSTNHQAGLESESSRGGLRSSILHLLRGLFT